MASTDKASISGSVTGGYAANNREFMSGLRLSGSAKRLRFYGSLLFRDAANFHAPDADPFSITGQRDDPKFTGEIPHTDYRQITGAAGIGVQTGIGLVAIAYNHYWNENNFLLPTGGPIGLRLINRTLSGKAVIPLGSIIIKPHMSLQQNHRQTTPGGISWTALPEEAVVDLKLSVYTGRLRFFAYSVGEPRGNRWSRNQILRSRECR